MVSGPSSLSRVGDHGRSVSRKPRKLQLRARADRQLETRRRIVAAAVALHQELGPLATTITGIAGRAGVERLTVYRHFPDERSLLRACTEHYFGLHPAPNPERWREVRDPQERLSVALRELYAYWDQTAPMFSSVLRDHEVDPDRAGAGVSSFMERARDALVDGWPARGGQRRLLRAAVGHAVHFYTWRSLFRDQGLSSAQAVRAMVAFVIASAAAPAKGTARMVRQLP